MITNGLGVSCPGVFHEEKGFLSENGEKPFSFSIALTIGGSFGTSFKN
jgi:hypothetical protein